MNLVLVFTPLQYLNAVAFKDQFNKKSKFIVLTTNRRNIDQIKLLDKDHHCQYPLEDLLFLPEEILWAVKLIYVTFFVSANNFSEVLIGNYNNVVAFVLALKFQRENKDLIFVDDGLATVNIYNDRNAKGVLRSPRLFGGQMIYIYRYFLRNKFLQKISFYTSLDLESLTHLTCDSIIQQEIMSGTKSRALSNEIWFVGSPLIEGGVLELKEFQHDVNIVRRYAKNNNLELKYILHRFESVEDDLNCQRFDLPIEIILNNADTIPKEIISYYSSALINIASLHPRIRCMYINLHKADPVKHNRLETVYKIFENHNNLLEFQSN